MHNYYDHLGSIKSWHRPIANYKILHFPVGGPGTPNHVHDIGKDRQRGQVNRLIV